MKDNLFDYTVTAKDPRYNAIRDNQNPEEEQTRLFIEDLWHKYEPYADRNFKQQIQVDFDSRFWEMYLACTLLDNSIPISKVNPGPDILVQHATGRIWIEAVAPTSGDEDNPDRIPAMRSRVAAIVPEDQIVLRYRGAIEEKYRKYQRYREMGIIAPTDAYVIALNGCKIPGPIIRPYPLILEAVLPIERVWAESISGWCEDFHIRKEIGRSSGATVRTDVFVNPEYGNLSAVLYSHGNAGNCPPKMGGDFIFIHNPLAVNLVTQGFLQVGSEYAYNRDRDSIKPTFWG
jgi:hypothetical protein